MFLDKLFLFWHENEHLFRPSPGPLTGSELYNLFRQIVLTKGFF